VRAAAGDALGGQRAVGSYGGGRARVRCVDVDLSVDARTVYFSKTKGASDRSSFYLLDSGSLVLLLDLVNHDLQFLTLLAFSQNWMSRPCRRAGGISGTIFRGAAASNHKLLQLSI
jgi:hypothetical protein